MDVALFIMSSPFPVPLPCSSGRPSTEEWPHAPQVLPEGSVVVDRLTSLCEAVVDHLRDTSSGRVSVARMELYFKLDASNRWFATKTWIVRDLS